MDRYTKKQDDRTYALADDILINTDLIKPSEIINRLAHFENFYCDLIKSQEKVIIELEVLRNEGKTSTVKFKQLFTTKLTNANIIGMLELYGIK